MSGAVCLGRLSPQASVKRAHTLSLEGEKLIDTKHYAVDSIRPKCHELQYLCDQFAAEVERRRGLLSKSLELHGLLEAVRPPPLPSWSRLACSFHMDRSQWLEAGPTRCCLWAFLEAQPLTAGRVVEFILPPLTFFPRATPSMRLISCTFSG